MEKLIETIFGDYANWLLGWKRRIGWAGFALFAICIAAALFVAGVRFPVMLTAIGLIGMAAGSSVLPAPSTSKPSAQNQFPYWLSQQTVIPAANGSIGPFPVNINDHSFNGVSLMATSTGAYSTTMTIGGRSFSSGPVHSNNMWGTAQLPFNLKLPMVFPKGTVVQITFTDLSGAANNTVNWSIHGYQYD
jgi:hypothetical protein